MLTASRLIHAGAGSPAPEGAIATAAACWWCGLPSPGSGRPFGDAIPDTFPDRHRAAVPASPVVCAPCAWTLSDRIALPADLADAGIGRRLDAGGRARLSVDGDDPGRPRLFLRLADGRIGVWSAATPTAREAPWLEARETLRLDPVDVGPCTLLAVVPESALSAGATARFRNYHHIATPSTWRPCTNADRAVLRDFLLAPPPAVPWVVVIGDGQKHGAIYADEAVVHPGDAPAAYVDGAAARWRAGDLPRWLRAVEQLRLAGVSDDEIRTGRYTRAPLAVRAHEPEVRPLRDRPACLDLVMFLRRLPKELPDG